MKSKRLILLFALVHGILYSCMLPLWEGFDEPIHYSSVESFSVWHRIPVIKETHISAEIRKSLELVPLSWLLNSGMGSCCTTFERWSQLGAEEKQRRIGQLLDLAAGLRWQQSDLLDWEAQQAPLAYMVLAPLDALLSSASLPHRILLLRLFCSAFAATLIYFAVCVLLVQLEVAHAFQFAVLACVFESEMLWASVAHIANDWLAIPLTICFLVALTLSAGRNRSGDLLVLAATFSVGLLTKAYFLVFAPVFVAFVIYKRVRNNVSRRVTLLAFAIPASLAGPWYLRNWLLYGSASGTQQSMAGIGISQVLAAIPRIDWPGSTLSLLRWSMWTGNWSFVSFSASTLDVELILLSAAFATYLFQYSRITKGEFWLLAACGCFALALVYQTCATWIHTKSISTNAEPWYAQGIAVCLWVLCFTGLQASGLIGRVVGILLCVTSAWIALVTYWAKLLPFYANGVSGRATGRVVLHWWLKHPTQDLQGVVLGPIWAVYALLAVFSALLILVTTLSALRLARS